MQGFIQDFRFGGETQHLGGSGGMFPKKMPNNVKSILNGFWGRYPRSSPPPPLYESLMCPCALEKGGGGRKEIISGNYCNLVIYAAKKIICDFVILTKILFLLNNIYANQIPGQSTSVKSFIFVSSYLCALTTTRIIHINNITT